MPRVFIDANVPLYASGKESPRRRPCQEILRALGRSSVGVTSAEVLQEVFHVAFRQRDLPRAREAIRDLDLALDGNVEPLLREDVLRAAEYDLPASLQARDRVHLAVMERLGVTRIVSADTDYDEAPGVERLDPMAFNTWRSAVFGAET